MKIAIIGTRGIPNNYGGFEQFAEQISVRLSDYGNDVYVYNPAFHTYKNNLYKKVNIIRIPCRENIFGSAAHFLYDYLCYKHAIKQHADVILVCGYGTSAPAIALINKHRTKVITNMDGFEWERAKYNSITKKLLKWFENIVVTKSDKIIADHKIIQEYYKNKYNILPEYISYGADITANFDELSINTYGLKKDNYFLVVARDEPENQIEFIITAWKNSHSEKTLCIVTNIRKLSKKYSEQTNIIFITGLYDSIKLSNLRHFSFACIHGHTVGGTNPSLLEAMAAKSFIIAHDNLFHKELLENNALFFNTPQSLTKIIIDYTNIIEKKNVSVQNNLTKITNFHQWDFITNEYLKLLSCL
ncbi:MAG: DUF1972 domain-containing protein [Bacteroidia bacterium]|nr:DUF1972 domain-containing protein [Bacteroidia bacterium]